MELEIRAVSLCNCITGGETHRANCIIFHSGPVHLTEVSTIDAWKESGCTCEFDYVKFARDVHPEGCPVRTAKLMRRIEEAFDGLNADGARPLVIYPSAQSGVIQTKAWFDINRQKLYD